MTRKQAAAFISPVPLIASMLLVFRVATRWAGPDVAWYVGMTVYWLVWCVGFSFLLLGWGRIRNFYRPRPITREVALLVFLPLVLAACFRLLTGTGYDKPNVWISVGLVVSAFANGALEETLWRGVFKEMFNDNIWLGIVWPSLMFGLWHYAPVSVHGNPWPMVVGATLFGFYMAFLVRRTGFVWWSIATHTLAAFVMIA